MKTCQVTERIVRLEEAIKQIVNQIQQNGQEMSKRVAELEKRDAVATPGQLPADGPVIG